MATRGRTIQRNVGRSAAKYASGRKNGMIRNVARGVRGRILTAGAARDAASRGNNAARGVRGGTGRNRAGTTYRRGGRTYMYVPTGVGRSTMAVQVRGRRAGAPAMQVKRKGRSPS